MNLAGNDIEGGEAMSEWTNVSPPCPWCGDEVSDSAYEDFVGELDDVVETACGGCGEPVLIEVRIEVMYRASKGEP